MLLNDMHEDWDECDNDTREGIVTLHTSGTGFWSSAKKAVRVTEINVFSYTDLKYGSMHVHFNTNDWRPDRDGLIYTDKKFIKELREYLNAQGYAGEDVSYSEQGMQGDNFLDCDVGHEFLKSYAAKHKEWAAELEEA